MKIHTGKPIAYWQSNVSAKMSHLLKYQGCKGHGAASDGASVGESPHWQWAHAVRAMAGESPARLVRATVGILPCWQWVHVAKTTAGKLLARMAWVTAGDLLRWRWARLARAMAGELPTCKARVTAGKLPRYGCTPHNNQPTKGGRGEAAKRGKLIRLWENGGGGSSGKEKGGGDEEEEDLTPPLQPRLYCLCWHCHYPSSLFEGDDDKDNGAGRCGGCDSGGAGWPPPEAQGWTMPVVSCQCL